MQLIFVRPEVNVLSGNIAVVACIISSSLVIIIERILSQDRPVAKT